VLKHWAKGFRPCGTGEIAAASERRATLSSAGGGWSRRRKRRSRSKIKNKRKTFWAMNSVSKSERNWPE
jgi:hypothetical protein